jgi:hypothetical protein
MVRIKRRKFIVSLSYSLTHARGLNFYSEYLKHLNKK